MDTTNNMAQMQHGTSTSVTILFIGVILFVLSLVGYMWASKLKHQNTSGLKKDQKAALKNKNKSVRWISHGLLGIGIVIIGIYFIQSASAKTNIENLNFNAPIQVTNDKDYGRGHTEAAVPYEMKIPTSGAHSPHDLKFGFYKDKPANEMLVHNLEHGDIIIYYNPKASADLIDRVKTFANYRKAGSGVLAVPSTDVSAPGEVVVTAWTKTMGLPAIDDAKIGTFIYRFINKGPEDIPAQIRQGGGTM